MLQFFIKFIKISHVYEIFIGKKLIVILTRWTHGVILRYFDENVSDFRCLKAALISTAEASFKILVCLYVCMRCLHWCLCPFLFAARTVRLRDWVLVLYGTDSHPRKSPTSVRSANNDYRRYDDWTRPHYYPFFSNFNHTVRPPPPTTTTTTTTTTTSTTTTTATTHMVDHGGSEWSRKGNGRHRTNHHRKNWESFIFGDSMNEAFASKSPAYARRKSQQLNPAAHTCVYETLAKKSNLSSNQQYPRNIRPKLTAGKLINILSFYSCLLLLCCAVLHSYPSTKASFGVASPMCGDPIEGNPMLCVHVCFVLTFRWSLSCAASVRNFCNGCCTSNARCFPLVPLQSVDSIFSQELISLWLLFFPKQT